ncbi:glycosyltransferase [Microbacterium saccharophilum]|uniref:Glycosyltransferase n=1 Tax=Microbacterium saccharophilum TaxID=1213358 RepID=A0A5C8I9R4_9MICO|nr:glycosyltransferase [Microbacterium saccharophilum]TXK15409.1 glycosyltransferase [Microbacterium saccharophilum]GEP47119.1 hypothetical protein MSA03_06270 [Microbacterium saccharophilum]
MSYDVGVVVPTLGERPAWLRQTLSSIRTQAGVTTKLVIVGPASPTLVSMASEFQASHIVSGPRGLSTAINEGFDALLDQCTFVTWLGDDDLLAPAALETLSQALAESPQARFGYGRTRYIDELGDTIHLSRPTRWAPLYMRIGKDYVPQPGSLLRASAIERRPVVDEGLRNAMDLELFLFLSEGGSHRWRYVPKELSAYRLHSASITATKGARDESMDVRRRYAHSPGRRLGLLVRPATRALEKVYDAYMWRTRFDSPPLVAGKPYTKPSS